jgi:dTDP-L-rhamnose 4-epimerase
MKKNVLITGGAGFIGSNLALELLSRGHGVRVLDNLSQQIHGCDPETISPLYASIKGKVEFIQGSVTSRETMERALEGQDVVVHLAAETGTGQSMYQIERYSEVNIQGTALLLDIITNRPDRVKKVVIASSRSIYGEGKYFSPEIGVVYPAHRQDEAMKAGDFEVHYPGAGKLEIRATDEDSKIHPSSVYGITKQVQEQLVMNVCGATGIAGVAFRYQNVYGPGQSLSNPYTGILSIFSNLIRSGKAINIFEDGQESRDFVFISDVVAATVAGIEKDDANGKVFNVGTGVATTVIDVARTLIREFGIEVPVEISGMYRLGDIRHNFADISRLKAELGVAPAVSFDEGIRRFVGWVKAQTACESAYEASITEMKEKGLLKGR